MQAVEKERGERWHDFAIRRGDPGLAQALYVARRCTGLSLRALGEAVVEMDCNAVHMAIKRFEERMAKDKLLRQMPQQILKRWEK